MNRNQFFEKLKSHQDAFINHPLNIGGIIEKKQSLFSARAREQLVARATLVDTIKTTTAAR